MLPQHPRAMRILSLMFALAGILPSLRATTVQKLTTADMIAKSTAIVHAKVSGTRTALRGPAIYTYYQLQVIESWKTPGIELISCLIFLPCTTKSG